jgi:molecular chaperone DnaJ
MGGPPGDLYVFLSVKNDPEFQRDGINILSQIKISYLQAILGCRLEINTVDGKAELTIPAGTQPNTVLTLENKGVPRLGNPVSRGDHLITVEVEIPTKITLEERELLENLAKIKGDRTGKGGLEGFLGNLFHQK